MGIGDIDIHPGDVGKIHPGTAQDPLYLVHGLRHLRGEVLSRASLAGYIECAVGQKAGAVSRIRTGRLNDFKGLRG